MDNNDELTIEEERQAGLAMGQNPFAKALAEAMVIYQCEGKLDGFTCQVVRSRIKARFGEPGLERWDSVAAAVMEALGETTDPGQLAQL